MERESIDAEEFNLLMEGKELPEVELEIDHSTGEDQEHAPAEDEPDQGSSSGTGNPPVGGDDGASSPGDEQID